MKPILTGVLLFASILSMAGTVGVPENVEPSTLLARDEFTNYVCRITGRVDACPDTVIGTVKTLGAKVPAAAAKALTKTENIEASWTGFDGRTLWIIGKNEVAELYAVYHFLESKLGVRWFQAKTKEDPGDWVPNMDRISLKPFEEFREPKFRIRMLELMRAYGNLPATNAQTCAVRNGFQVNAPYGPINYARPKEPNTVFYAPRVPHRLTNLGGDHGTFSSTCPAKDWFAKHPEYFALVDGKRKSGLQYCISNPGLRQAVTDRIIRSLDRNYGNGQFVFGMVDTTYGWCECDACRALDDPAAVKSITPNVTRRFMLTVKHISEKVWAKYPKADLRMWAYHTYRRRAMDVKLDKRMRICFCDHGRCYGHALDDPTCNRNVEILRMLKEWMASGHQVYVYAYLLCTTPYYTCSEMMQADDIRKYVKLGVMGWKEEGVYSDSRFVNLKDPRLRDVQPSNWQWCYLTSHMLWDPTLDPKALIDDAESKYYGAAYPAMKKYHAFRRRLWEGNPAHMGYPDGDQRRPQMLDVPGSKERLLGLLDQADRLSGGDDVLKFRLARDRRWLETYWIEANEKLKAKRAKPAFAAAWAESPVVADGRLSEAVWMRTRYADFGGTSVGAAYRDGQIAFSITGPEPEPSFCLYPPNIDNRRYRFTVRANGRVECESEPGGTVAGAYGAKASLRKTPLGTACEIDVPVGGIYPVRTGEMWQVMFGRPPAGFDWCAGTGYSSLTFGLPYRMNGNFAALYDNGMPKDWVFADGEATVEKSSAGNELLVTGRMFHTMASGELAAKGERRIRFSFRASGDGKVRVVFYRYKNVAKDTSSRKHEYRRVNLSPHGEGGVFKLASDMRTYTGEYTIARGEWCAIAFHCDGAKGPVRFADVSVTRIYE